MADSKKYNNKYWETEEGETIEFGNSFMRCFDKAGKLQYGKIIRSKSTGEKTYVVKFVMDRKELFASEEGADYLQGTLEEWKEVFESEENDN